MATKSPAKKAPAKKAAKVAADDILEYSLIASKLGY